MTTAGAINIFILWTRNSIVLLFKSVVPKLWCVSESPRQLLKNMGPRLLETEEGLGLCVFTDLPVCF